MANPKALIELMNLPLGTFVKLSYQRKDNTICTVEGRLSRIQFSEKRKDNVITLYIHKTKSFHSIASKQLSKIL